MKRLLSVQPLLTTAVITAAVDLAIAYGLSIPPGAKAPLITIITAAATLFVHQTVASPATVVQVAKDTAESLTDTTAGAAGVVTAPAAEIVDTVVSGVGGLVGALAPRAKEV